MAISAFSILLLSSHDGDTCLEHRGGGGRMGLLQWKLLLKVPEECPSSFWCRGRLGVGEAVGQGGHFNDDNP